MNDCPLVDKHSEERRNRIRLSIAAYAYETGKQPTMSDGEYDKLSLMINVQEDTFEEYHTKEYKQKCMIIDAFFREHFSPDTGQWIYKHPYYDEVAASYWRQYGRKLV